MYGVDSFVHPAYRGKGIGGKLMEARFDVARRLNLCGMVAGSLIRDYHKVADQLPVEQYVREVIEGKRFDTNLSKQLRKGFKVHNLIPNFSDSWRSQGWGVAIVWENPDYRPTQPTHRKVHPQRYPFISTGGRPHTNPSARL
jgi:predicted GNAT family acetyltransferase